MEIKVVCTKCGKGYRVNSALLGKYLQCRSCDTLFPIKAAAKTAPPQPAPVADVQDLLELPPEALQAPLPVANPLTQQRGVHGHAATASSWRQPTLKNLKGQQKGFSGTDRALLYLGGFLLVVGLLAILMPLFGVQFARLREMGTLALIIGLVMGLAGSGLLAAGLRNQLVPAVVTGATTAAAVLVAFAVTFLIAPEVSQPTSEPTKATPVVSVWKQTYPDWRGFSGRSITSPGGDSKTASWPRYLIETGGYWLGFPAPTGPAGKRENKRIGQQSVPMWTYSFANGSAAFVTRHFELPKSEYQGARPEQILTSLLREIANVPGSSPVEARPVTVENCPGIEFEYRAQRSGQTAQGMHGRIVLRDRMVVIVLLSGPAGTVPGTQSRRFLSSLQFEPNWKPPTADLAQGGGDPGTVDASDALDPFEFQRPASGNGDADASFVEDDGSPAAGFLLSPEDQIRDQNIRRRRRQVEVAMDTELPRGARTNFSQAYLTSPSGGEGGSSRFWAHPGKLPVTGIDAMTGTWNGRDGIRTISPLYDQEPTDGQTIIAKDGYGLAAVNINSSSIIEGVQFVFQRVTDRGFDTSDSYTSEWIGKAPADGQSVKIGGQGRPIYGIWVRQGVVINALGLITEANY